MELSNVEVGDRDTLYSLNPVFTYLEQDAQSVY